MTDPITAIVIIGAAFMYVPSRIRPLDEEDPQDRLACLVQETVVVPIAAEVPSTMVPAYLTGEVIAPVEIAKQALEQFRGVDEVSDASIDEAVAFLGALPGSFPIPAPALAEDGTVGLFWDSKAFYADIEFHGDGTLSLFARHRGATNRDIGVGPVAMKDVSQDWLYEHLSPVTPPLAVAA